MSVQQNKHRTTPRGPAASRVARRLPTAQRCEPAPPTPPYRPTSHPAPCPTKPHALRLTRYPSPNTQYPIPNTLPPIPHLTFCLARNPYRAYRLSRLLHACLFSQSLPPGLREAIDEALLDAELETLAARDPPPPSPPSEVQPGQPSPPHPQRGTDP